MSTQRTRITRWPPYVRDRHAGKITIYGWSTKDSSASSILVGLSVRNVSPPAARVSAGSRPTAGARDRTSRRTRMRAILVARCRSRALSATPCSNRLHH
jgi:hypothetical protein